MRRLASKTVLMGLRADWFLAASPINRSDSEKDTYDGVVRLPWSLAMISTRSSCQTPTQLYVVPRSIPTACPVVAIVVSDCVCEKVSIAVYVREC